MSALRSADHGRVELWHHLHVAEGGRKRRVSAAKSDRGGARKKVGTHFETLVERNARSASHAFPHIRLLGAVRYVFVVSRN